MFRTALGGLAGGLAMYLVGFVFWGTPLANLAIVSLDDARTAAVQQALAANLTETGSGSYPIPWPVTSATTTLYGRGPVAMVHYNVSGFPVMDSGSLLGGLILAVIAALIIAFAMRAIAPQVTGFAARAGVVIAFSVAIPLYIALGQPVFTHAPWPYFVYSFLCDALGFAAAGLVIVRWFLPSPEPAG